MRRNSAKFIALGGMMAALALVVMCLGGMIPAATYVCPMVCAVILSIVLRFTGKRIAWAWYGAVALLSLLVGPDKEAAAVFVFIGYYPIIKPWMDRRPFSVVWKLLLFNCTIVLMYQLLIHLFGMTNISDDFAEVGTLMTVVMLVLGNVIFFMLDVILKRFAVKK